MPIPIAVIGGSGLYELLDDGASRVIRSPYGDAEVTVGTLGGRKIVFLPRHASRHSVPPHRINERANLWALASLGVRAVVSTAAVGSIDPALRPGAFAIADQLLDRTWGRHDTYFDGDAVDAAGEPLVRHLPFAQPFCPVLRGLAVDTLPSAAPAATVAVIPGPRFSTAAESAVLRHSGAHLVNMTLCPEVALAAELGMGTVTICVITDTDSGEADDGTDAVTAELVFSRLSDALAELTAGISRLVAAIPDDYAPRPLIDQAAIDAVLAQRVIGA